MSKVTANFPSSVWDGSSARRTDPDNVDRGPDWQDWDQLVSEVIAMQDAELSPDATGTVPTVTGLSVAGRQVSGKLKVERVTLAAVNVAFANDDVTHGNFGSQEILDLPEGNILVLGATASLTLTRVGTALTATAAIVAGVGTSAAAVSAGDGTLAAAEANVIPSTAFTLSSGTIAAHAAVSTGVKAIDGHTSAGKLYLNFQVPTAGSSGTDALTVTGHVDITYVDLGDA